MKRFLLVSCGFFIAALVTIVVVYFFIKPYLPGAGVEQPPREYSPEKVEAVVSELASTTGITIPDEGFSLQTIELDAAKEKALSLAGIDTESFVVSKAMLACGVEKIGMERMAVIAAGEAPSLEEVTKLLPCLKAE